MADGQPVVRPQADRGLDPDDVARRTFAMRVRGYDQHEVRGFLVRLASEIRTMAERERDLRNRLEAIEARPPPDQPSEEQLFATLGQEAARVLQAAKEAAADIRGKAEEHVARLVREAQEEAARVRSEAEQLLDLRTTEAEHAAEAIRAEATEAAEAEVEQARARGKEMLAEAQAVRERILRDLARRRRLAHQQIEQLRAGRDRLLAAYQVVRQTLDEATGELTGAEAEARAAAEAAAMRTSGEPEPSVEELEVELAAIHEAAPPTVEAETVQGETVEAESVDAETVDDAPARAASAADASGEADQAATAPAEANGAPPDKGADDRRSSSLRLLRRRREPTSEEPPAAHARAVDVGDEMEGVRVLRPDEPPAPEQPEAQPVETEPVETEPVEPGPETHTDVDELFARIKADREAAVAKAEAVLGEADAEVEATAAHAEPPAEETSADDVEAEDVEATVDHDHDLLVRRDELVRPLARAAARAVKRVLTDEQNEVLDRLRRHRGTPTAAALLPDEALHASRYAGAVSEHLARAASAGAQFVGNSSGDGNGDGDGAKVGDLTAAFAADLVSGLRERVERCVDEAGRADNGATEAEEGLADRVSATYREWKSQRAEVLVGDAVIAAFSKGAYDTTPDGTSMRWIVDFGGKACPDGDDNALAGPTVKGQRFPTGQCHPPAHAGCRCLLVPDVR